MRRRAGQMLAAVLLASALVAVPSNASGAAVPVFDEEVLVGVPRKDIGSAPDAGVVHWVPTVAGELRYDRDLLITEAMVGGEPGPGHHFGAVLTKGRLNGDYLDDLVIGAPGADDGAGRVYVVFASSAGSDRIYDFDHAVMLRQGTRRVGGRREPGDRFGRQVVIGVSYRPFPDYDQPWLAVGAPREDVGGAEDAGAVFIVSFAAAPETGRVIVQGRYAPGLPEPGDHFGSSLGSVEGTLLVGAPGQNVGPADDAGEVDVLRRSGPWPGGGVMEAVHQGVVRPNGQRVLGHAEAGDRFGSSLMTAGLLGVGVGIPGEDVGNAVDAGAVAELGIYAWRDGGPAFNDLWYQGGHGLSETAEAGDRFGTAISVDDNGNFLVGVPGEDLGGVPDAGLVHVIARILGFSNHVGYGDAVFSQSASGLGEDEPGDAFGSAVGHSATRKAEIAAAGEDVGRVSDAGSFTRLRMTPDLLLPTPEGALVLSGNQTGLEGTAERDDRFGDGLISGR